MIQHFELRHFDGARLIDAPNPRRFGVVTRNDVYSALRIQKRNAFLFKCLRETGLMPYQVLSARYYIDQFPYIC